SFPTAIRERLSSVVVLPVYSVQRADRMTSAMEPSAPMGAGWQVGATGVERVGLPRYRTHPRAALSRSLPYLDDPHFAKRSSTLRVIRSTTLSPPRRPCAQSVVPAVTTVPPRVYVPRTAWPVRPFSQRSYHSQSLGCQRAGAVATIAKSRGVPSRSVGTGNPSFRSK